MKPANSESPECRAAAPAVPRLEDLVPIAVVVAAGCENCAERLVKRALERGSEKPTIARTLRIVADLRSRDCFARAVGPEVIARMAGPLEAGEKALRAAAAADRECCGEKRNGGKVRS